MQLAYQYTSDVAGGQETLAERVWVITLQTTPAQFARVHLSESQTLFAFCGA